MTESPDVPSKLGAYGFWLPGLAGAARWMQPVRPTAPALHLAVEVAAPHGGPSYLDGERADLGLLGHGRLRAERGTGTVRYALLVRPPDEDMLHPYLAAAAGLVWRWSGREALHAGAFRVADGAALLLGGKEAGKSTTLAWLAGAARVGIVADDLAVLDGDRVHAGPRTVDLRGGIASLAAAERGPTLRAVRGGERARLSLSPVPSELPVVGVAVLEWAPAVEVTPVPLAERWAILGAQRMFPRLPTDGLSVLALVGVPMIRIGRPRDIAAVAATGEAILDAFGRPGPEGS